MPDDLVVVWFAAVVVLVALMVYDQLFETYTHVHLGIALTQDLACVLSTSNQPTA